MPNKISGGITMTIDYLLSPLSWWNDLLINMPIAYGFAYLCSLFNKNIFLPAMVVGYWLTNIAGFILMHYGGQKLLSNKSKKYSKNDFYKDIIISPCYTLLVYIFFKIGWLKLPTN